MEKNSNEQIEKAYQQIKTIYRKQGLLHSFYTFYRNFSCPMKRIFSLIPQGKGYIDVGCGYGFISIWTALVFPDSRVVGMDVVASRMDFANRIANGIENLEFMVKDITKEDIDESESKNPVIGDADVILLIDLFHHIPFENQMSFLKQCMDRVPEGGYIVFKDIDTKPWWKFRVNYIQDYLFTREKTYSRNKDEYMEFLKENGFTVEYFDLKKGYPYSHYLIRARKETAN